MNRRCLSLVVPALALVACQGQPAATTAAPATTAPATTAAPSASAPTTTASPAPSTPSGPRACLESAKICFSLPTGVKAEQTMQTTVPPSESLVFNDANGRAIAGAFVNEWGPEGSCDASSSAQVVVLKSKKTAVENLDPQHPGATKTAYAVQIAIQRQGAWEAVTALTDVAELSKPGTYQQCTGATAEVVEVQGLTGRHLITGAAMDRDGRPTLRDQPDVRMPAFTTVDDAKFALESQQQAFDIFASAHPA